MRRIVLAILIFLALGPVPGPHQQRPAIDLSQAVTVRPLGHPADKAGPLRFVRGWRLTSPNSHFGGFSALARKEPGRFLLIGDNGYATWLTLPAGAGVTAATAVRIRPLPTPDGAPRRKSLVDAEAMVFDAEADRLWIALEGINQVWRLDAALTRIESSRKLPEPRWPANRGPEAMARLADGRTIILSEDADDDPRGREALIFTGDPAVPGKPPVRFFYDARGKGLVSDAAALPDGRILLVHRRLGFDPVFTTILAILDPADISRDAVVHSRTIGRVARPLADNFEGATVAVEDGRTYLWLVSDDNFNGWQRSLLLQFELIDLPDSKKAAP